MKPIPNQFVLTVDEMSQINESVGDYNSKLQAVAASKGLAFVDVNAFLQKAKTGIMYNGVGMNAQFVTGGIFSLDGIHFTPRGNALLANEFIKAINSKYGAKIPMVNATMYNGVIFP
jgi:lysophospholipase L1-like esterase